MAPTRHSGPGAQSLIDAVVAAGAREEVDPALIDLEVYAADLSPAAYSMQLEVDGVERDVTAAGLDTFHLVGYSGAGAVRLDLCVQHPERLRSLAIFKPANVPGPWGP